MTSDTVGLEYKNHIAWLTLNRPEHRNALTEEMAGAMEASVREIQGRTDIRVLVITGAEKAFCAGGDLGMLQELVGRETSEIEQRFFDLYNRVLSIRELQIPVIACMNGPAVGAGAALALACDFRWAAKGIQIGFTFVRLGLNPGMASEYLLSRLVGPSKAMELLMSGQTIRSEEALALGLVNRIASRQRLRRETREFAERLAAMPSGPLAVIKRLIHRGDARDLRELVRVQAHEQALCYQGPDVAKRLQAMVEARGQNP